jgi:molecular chaperone DnaK (HSP70)
MRVANRRIQDGQGVIIVDAGGGTIDVSAYQMTTAPSFEEIAPAECKSI